MSVTVPIAISWRSMFVAKLMNAMQTRSLALFAFALTSLSLSLQVLHGGTFFSRLGQVFAGLLLLRLAVMALSSFPSKALSARFNGTASFDEDGVHLANARGTDSYPWSWVLSARETPTLFVLRCAERGGRLLLMANVARVSDPARLRELLHRASKLPK